MKMKKQIILLAMLLMFGAAFAGPEKINTALSGVKELLCTVLPVVIMLAIVIAAILYAVGQLGSAESRAKFHGWATNIVIGAITALIVLLITPYFLGMLLPTGMNTLTQCGAQSQAYVSCRDACYADTTLDTSGKVQACIMACQA
jgi:hypothetical protein